MPFVPSMRVLTDSVRTKDFATDLRDFSETQGVPFSPTHIAPRRPCLKTERQQVLEHNHFLIFNKTCRPSFFFALVCLRFVCILL